MQAGAWAAVKVINVTALLVLQEDCGFQRQEVPSLQPPSGNVRGQEVKASAYRKLVGWLTVSLLGLTQTSPLSSLISCVEQEGERGR